MSADLSGSGAGAVAWPEGCVAGGLSPVVWVEGELGLGSLGELVRVVCVAAKADGQELVHDVLRVSVSMGLSSWSMGSAGSRRLLRRPFWRVRSTAAQMP